MRSRILLVIFYVDPQSGWDACESCFLLIRRELSSGKKSVSRGPGGGGFPVQCTSHQVESVLVNIQIMSLLASFKKEMSGHYRSRYLPG